jgi:aspartyl-tRNA(Asn)/glutamyl-tRNA(Gln) amidotransferase subunit C
MKADKDLIDRLSHLARLEFNEQEQGAIQDDLNKIFAFVEQLQKLDTTGVEPLVYMNEDWSVARPDVQEQTITKVDALKNAPSKDSDYFKVPKVLTKK